MSIINKYIHVNVLAYVHTYVKNNSRELTQKITYIAALKTQRLPKLVNQTEEKRKVGDKPARSNFTVTSELTATDACFAFYDGTSCVKTDWRGCWGLCQHAHGWKWVPHFTFSDFSSKNRFLSRKETCGPVLSIYPAYLLCLLEPEGLFFTFELKNNLNVKTLKIFPQKYLNNSLS